MKKELLAPPNAQERTELVLNFTDVNGRDSGSCAEKTREITPLMLLTCSENHTQDIGGHPLWLWWHSVKLAYVWGSHSTKEITLRGPTWGPFLSRVSEQSMGRGSGAVSVYGTAAQRITPGFTCCIVRCRED